jgi:integrase/recombinase XerD
MQDGAGPSRRKGRAPAGCYWRGQTLWARVKIRGQEFRRSLETDDERTAKKRRTTLKKELTALRRGDARLTFAQALDEWRTWIKRQVGSVNTVKAYAGSLKQLAPWLSGKYLDEITGKLVKEIVKGRREQGVKDATIKRDLNALSSVLNMSIDEDYCEDNPVLPRLKRIKERRDPILLPSDEDVAKVVAAAPGMLAQLIVAARVTGCRQGELTAATHGWLDRKAKRLTVIGKGNKLRVVDLVPFDGFAVFDALPHAISNPPLFVDGNGEPYHRKVATLFCDLTEQIAKRDPSFRRFRFHDLRHLHAVEWLRSGRSIYDLQQRLGHASITTTEWYLKYLTAEEQRQVKTTGATGSTKSGTAPSVGAGTSS